MDARHSKFSDICLVGFLLMVAGVVPDLFGKLLTLGDLFLKKHRFLLGINKIDHASCPSLQRGKEDSQTNQMGRHFIPICHTEVSDKEKKSRQ